ncbi:DUF4355 domain-containing protein [Clostridium sp. C2-6-12]|uniref:DUF4355 domain-containing protein n=1 Tax=Clostridium sp. C2-6-12 TaxID=2698832 RepID=UPI00136937D1|nr:DUF4355 domain-containing protein [Clostridium sp. C2-6-12]
MYFKLSQKKLQADSGLGFGADNAQKESVIGVTEETTSNNGTQQDNNQKTFTQEDLDKIISKRLDKAQKKWEQDAQSRFEELKMSNMTPEQKQEYEKSKLDQKLSEKEKQLQIRELKLDAIDKLQEKGLPKELSEILDYSNTDTVDSSIEVIKKSIDKIVSDKLKGEDITKLKGLRSSVIYEARNGESPSAVDPFLQGLKSSK